MARPIPTASGTYVQYYGFDFPAPIRTDVQMIPEYDKAGRTVIGIRQIVRILTTIVSGDLTAAFFTGGSFEANLRILEARLSAPGYNFLFRGAGYGRLTSANPPSNSDGTIATSEVDFPDLKFGPKPRINALRNLGGGNCAYLDWQIEVYRFPYSDSGTNYPSLYGHFNFSIDWIINDQNLLQRTITGSFETLVQRRGANGTNWNITSASAADQRQALLNGFQTLQGFTRSQRDHLSEDRRVLTFSITDTEIDTPTPYYPGCCHMSVRHRVHTDMPLSAGNSGGLMFENSLTGRIRVDPGIPKQVAWQAFLAVVNAKLVSTANTMNNTTLKDSAKLIPIIFGLTIEEDIFGREVNFQVVYRFTTTLENVFIASGILGQNALIGNWKLWDQQRIKTRQRALTAIPNWQSKDDLIVNFNTPISPYNPRALTAPRENQQRPAPLSGKPPPKENSWLMFQNVLLFHAGNNSQRVSTVGRPAGGILEGVVDISATPGQTVLVPSDYVVDPGGYKKGYVYMIGAAVRCGWPIKTPTITSIQSDIGNEKIDVDDWRPETNIVIGNALGVPVYFSRWYKKYKVVGNKMIKIVVTGEPTGFQPQALDLRFGQ